MTADNTATAVADAQAETRARLAQLKADVEREYWASRPAPAPVPAFQPPAPQWTPVYEPFQHVVYTPFPTSAPAPIRRRSIVGNLRMAWLAVKVTIAVAMLWLFALAALHEALS